MFLNFAVNKMRHHLQVRLSYLAWLLVALVSVPCLITDGFPAQDEVSHKDYTDRVIAELNVKAHASKTDSVETITATYSKGLLIIQKGTLLETQDNRWRRIGSTYAGQTVSDFVIVSDGTTVWSQNSLLQTVLKRPVEPLPSWGLHSGQPIVADHEGIRWQVLGKTELRPEQAVYEFEGRLPDAPGASRKDEWEEVVLVKAWIGADDGLPYKVTKYNKDRKEVSTTVFTNYHLNVPIDPTLFRFEIPPGMQVIDLAKSDDGGSIKLHIKTRGSQPVKDAPVQ